MPPQSFHQFLGSIVHRAGPNSATLVYVSVRFTQLSPWTSPEDPHTNASEQNTRINLLCKGKSLKFKEGEMQSQASQTSEHPEGETELLLPKGSRILRIAQQVFNKCYLIGCINVLVG